MKKIKLLFNKLAAHPAVKLANEWRDTLGLSATFALTAACFSNDKVLFGTIGIWSLREQMRMFTWLLGNKFITAGTKQREPNARTNGYAALFVANSLSMSAVAATLYKAQQATNVVDQAQFLQDNSIIIAIAPVFAMNITMGMMVTGPKKSLQLYRDLLWDYPRKKDDGGTTQTEKLIQGIAQSLSGTKTGLARMVNTVHATGFHI